MSIYGFQSTILSICSERKEDLSNGYIWTWTAKIVQEPRNLCSLGATTCVSTWHIFLLLIHRLEAPFQYIVFKHYLLFWFLFVKWGNLILERLSKVLQPVNSTSWEWKLLWLQGQLPATVPHYLLEVLFPTLLLPLFGSGTWNKSLEFLNLSFSSIKNHKNQPTKVECTASALLPWLVGDLYRTTVSSVGLVSLAVMKHGDLGL